MAILKVHLSMSILSTSGKDTHELQNKHFEICVRGALLSTAARQNFLLHTHMRSKMRKVNLTPLFPLRSTHTVLLLFVLTHSPWVALAHQRKLSHMHV